MPDVPVDSYKTETIKFQIEIEISYLDNETRDNALNDVMSKIYVGNGGGHHYSYSHKKTKRL